MVICVNMPHMLMHMSQHLLCVMRQVISVDYLQLLGDISYVRCAAELYEYEEY